MTLASVLFVDDDSEALISIIRAIKAFGVEAELHGAGTAQKGLEMAAKIAPNVFVLDLCLDEKVGVESGFSLLQALTSQYPDARFIVLTGHGGTETGIRALKLGASSFLEKPADVQHLAALVRDGIAQSRIRLAYRAQQNRGASFESLNLCGASAAIKRVQDEVRYAASNSLPVLLLGETGTGKGVCAYAIHSLSHRSHRSFVRYQPNFATADLVNSDLFGHVKGAFTGATEDRKGLVGEADKGTLFLDEIEELPLETQVTMLGVIQERKYRATGSNRPHDSDFRLICASNSNVDDDIKAGKLRRDFYHRIAHQVITLPPLRSRKEDIKILADHFLERVKISEQLNVFGIGADALSILESYDWPGNIRELESTIQSSALRAQFNGTTQVTAKEIQLVLATQQQATRANGFTNNENEDFASKVESYKFKLIEDCLAKHGGNQVAAAKELKIDRSSMRRILKRQPV